jgi:hypothetical protein
MPRDIVRRAQAFPAASVVGLALGAVAARFQALEVDELTVRKLRVREQELLPPRA